ncbi:MAG: leucyl aminopeptidase [Moraxella sp.]|nr:leucyl aminopeptidase [Moraxella sp.]
MKLTVSTEIILKKPSKNNPLPVIVLYADKDGNLLGNLPAAEHTERAAALIKATNFIGNAGESISDYSLQNNELPIITIIGIGTLDTLAAGINKVIASTYKAIKSHQKAIIAWGDVICEKHFGQFVRRLLGSAYRFDSYKSDAGKADAITAIDFINTKVETKLYKDTLQLVQAVVLGQNLARDVANEPPNIMTPNELANIAKQLGKDHSDKLSVSVLGEKEMEKLGMGCFLAVSKGSDEEGKLIVLEYRGKSDKPTKGKKAKLDNPIALVGKGITFDTGGISLKPSAGMDEMKYDMGGAAAMLGTIKAVCEANLVLDVVVVLACAENMPSGRATRPGDIVTAMNGMSVEILNTDAEGRLVLCDALCYVQDNYKPCTIIDAATLTGACVIALGNVRSGLYCNDEDTLFALQSASEHTGDLVWQMPLDDEYNGQLKSKFADVQNIGGREGGSITAACYLQRFIKDGQAWAHLDIAGTAWTSGENKGATGRPVPMLVQYLANQAG